jgi:hypothetical protein
VKLRHSKLSIPAHGQWLTARLSYAPDLPGLVLVLQSSGALLDAPVADVLQQAGYATLALNLLAESEEARAPDGRFNIAALTERILASIEWVDNQPGLASLPLGILASDTACAASVRAVARIPHRVGAFCILAGRPDLAGAAPLRALQTPTCFITTRNDPRSAILKQAYDRLKGVRDWKMVATDADTNANMEPGQMSAASLAASAEIAVTWMNTHLPTRAEDQAVAFFPSLAVALSFAPPFQPPHEK